MVFMYQIVKAMQYMAVKVKKRMPLEWSTFFDVENSTPLAELEPTISIKTHKTITHKKNKKQCILNIFLYISGSKQRNCIRKWQKYELQMSDDSHFEFYDLWKNGAIYNLAYGRYGFSTQKNHIETSNEVLFLKNAYRSLSRAIFQFLTWLISLFASRILSAILSIF